MDISPFFSGLATLTSAFVLAVIATINIRIANRTRRETFTTTVMLTLLTNERLSEAYNLVMRYAERHLVIDPTTLTEREDNLVAALLSMFEFIAISSENGTMDRDIILRQRRSGLRITYQICAQYISHKRRVWDRPNAYRTFERFVVSNADGSKRDQAGPELK